MSRAMYRYAVGLDGPVEIGLTGEPVAFGAISVPLGAAGIEFWAERDDDMPELARIFVVVGTGHRIPEAADRKSVVEGKRVDLGGRRIIKKKKTTTCGG